MYIQFLNPLIFSDKSLDPASVGTANFLLFMDKLFDSLNGSKTIHKKESTSKFLRSALTPKSDHLRFWEEEALRVLKSAKFFKGGKQFVPPSLKNFIHNIEAVKHIWNNLKKKYITSLCTRNLNQDPVENFFGCIRSQAGRNINPSSSSFASSFKTLLVNNMASCHSPGMNCEDDENEGLLQNLRNFLSADVPGPRTPHSVEVACYIKGEENFNFNSNKNVSIIGHELNSYLSGFIVKKLLKKISCSDCIEDLVNVNDSNQGTPSVLHPDARTNACSKFKRLFSRSCQIINYFLPKICSRKNLSNILKIKLDSYVLDKFEWSCARHKTDFRKHFLNLLLKFYIHSWVKNINKILKGQDNRNIHDEVKKKARAKYIQNKIKQKKISTMKKLISPNSA